MAWNTMGVGLRLRLGLGAILCLVLGLGALAWHQTDHLWLQTQELYEHPHQVSRAVGRLEADILSIEMGIKDLLQVTSEQEIPARLQEIVAHKADAARQIAILSDRYLGSRETVVAISDGIVAWDVIQEETLRLLRSGKRPEAVARTRPGGEESAQGEFLMALLGKVDAFAERKSREFFETARERKDAINRQLLLVGCLILLASLAVSMMLVRAVRGPVLKLTAAAERLRKGDLSVRTGRVSGEEFALLSTAFDAMAETLERQRAVTERTGLLADVMLRETDLGAFCRELLKALVEHTGSQSGGVYLLDPENRRFERYVAIGLAEGARDSFSADAPEGEFGRAVVTGKIQRIAEIPEDTPFLFPSSTGTFRPREIVTLPLGDGEETLAVVSLASLRGYDLAAMEVLDRIFGTLTARMNGVLAFRRIQDLAERLERQNRELDAQKRELAAQAGELSGQNRELEIQKRMLDEANRLKSVFLSNMSHELRTPLNSVIALSGVLHRRLKERIPEEEYGFLEVIERNGRQLLSLINDILDLSRIEAGKEDLHLNHFSLEALVQDVLAMIGPQAKEKGIALRLQKGEPLPPVYSDPKKCLHILQNLVANGVKFTEEGVVEVSLGRTENACTVSVRDTGIGIPAEELPHIFEAFRQVDGSSSRRYGGTGLGLSIAKRYAEMLGGRVDVESTPKKGSVFTLRLPQAPGPAGVPEAAELGLLPGRRPQKEGPSGGQGKTLLLVEDNAPAIVQMCDILEAEGYRVRVAGNGREALDRVREELPDAMILDLMMPEMDGFEVLEAIRNEEKTSHLPVLILTARHVTREELGFLKGNHIHELIQKGDVNRRELLALVAGMVAGRQEAHPSPGRPAPRARPGARPLILVVEDNRDNLRTLRALLDTWCTVIEAMDGRSALEQAQRHGPDCILMDLALPVMDGFASLEAIRNDDTLRHIPVVAVTASAMRGDREEVLARGFDGYVAKPIEEALLLRTLEEVSGLRRGV